MNSQNALSHLSLVAQRYLKKIDSSEVKSSYCNVNKSSHDLFSSSMGSEFSPDVSSLSLMYDNQNTSKLPDQSLWDNKCSFESSTKVELESFQSEQPIYSKQNQSIEESAYGSMSTNNYNIAEVSCLQKNDELRNDTGISFGSPEIKKRKTEDSFLELTVATDIKNDTRSTERLFGNDTISSVFMMHMKTKIIRDSQPILNQYQVKDNHNRKLFAMPDHRSNHGKLKPLSQKPKKLEKSVFKAKNNIDESIFNKSVQCIDDTIVSQNYNLDAIEMSVIMDEKLNLNSSYKTRKIFNSNSHLIREFYKVTTQQNWNFLVENSPEMIEPSLEYIEYNRKPKDNINFGAAKEDIEIVFSDCTEITESMQELEESFNNPKGVVCSTPTNDLIPSQNELIEIPRSNPVIQEVVIEENSEINTTSGTEILFETSECEALDSSIIDSNTNIECLSLARCVDIAEENALNSPSAVVHHQVEDDIQLISQFACPIGPEIEHQE